MSSIIDQQMKELYTNYTRKEQFCDILKNILYSVIYQSYLEDYYYF